MANKNVCALLAANVYSVDQKGSGANCFVCAKPYESTNLNGR